MNAASMNDNFASARATASPRRPSSGRPAVVPPATRRLLRSGIVGDSPALAGVLRQAELAARLNIGVLITGPTGTGKSQIARVIHDNGPRSSRPFLEINCSAIPDSLFESELFGALPGAYTGATRRIEGKVEAARGGTLFLDEVGELSIVSQSKLLQFLHGARHYYPLGSSVVVTADVRVIAATNIDLPRAIEERIFRSDLFFRLQRFVIRMPTLAERPEDIGPLAAHFCQEACNTFALGPLSLSEGALRAIQAADWPGNVRQLESTIEAAAVRAADEGSPSIDVAHLVLDGGRVVSAAGSAATFREQTRAFQRGVVLRALQETRWNVSAAARSLDLTRAHIHNLMQSMDIVRQEACGGSRAETGIQRKPRPSTGRMPAFSWAPLGAHPNRRL